MVSVRRLRRVWGAKGSRAAAAAVALVAVVAAVAWAVDWWGGKHREAELFDPDGVVSSWTTGPLDDYEVDESTVSFRRPVAVVAQSAGSRRVLLSYIGNPCAQAPVVVVRRVSQREVSVYIAVRMAKRLGGCEGSEVPYLVELVLVEPLAVRSALVVESRGVGKLREAPPGSLPELERQYRASALPPGM